MKGRLAVKGGKYYVVISYKDEEGQYKNKWIATGLEEKNNKRAASDLLRSIVSDFNNGNNPSNSVVSSDNSQSDSPLFSDYMYEWLNSTKAHIQISTYSNYKMRTKTIAEYFRAKKIRLNELKPKDIQDFYTTMQEKGKSIQECHHLHIVLHRALQIAYRCDYIPSNPADKIEKPKSPKYKAKFYTAAQMATLFEKLEGDPYGFVYKLTAIYGLRRSEVIGLRWSSIDFDNNTITLDHSIVQCNLEGKRQIISKDVMKNQSSMRTLPLLPSVKEMLLNLKKTREKNAVDYGNCYVNKYEDYISVDELGNLIKPDTLTIHFKSFLVRNNLPIIRLHDLRHSCASILIASGVGMKAVQEWLGHSTFSTTADIYSHLNYSSKMEIADKLSDVFKGIPLVQEQTSPSVIEQMQKIFASADIDKATTKKVDLTENIEDENVSYDEENDTEFFGQGKETQLSNDNKVNDFLKAKSEMKRLGLSSIDEYFEYLEYIKKIGNK